MITPTITAIVRATDESKEIEIRGNVLVPTKLERGTTNMAPWFVNGYGDDGILAIAIDGSEHIHVRD